MLSVTLIAVGKLKEKFYLAAVEEYAKRLAAFCKFSLIELPEQRLPDDPSPAQIAAGLAAEAALIEALENGRLAGAGLDVTDPEPVAPTSPLFKLPNVIVTPHYAPTTVEAATRVSEIAAENINAVLAGKEPAGRIV